MTRKTIAQHGRRYRQQLPKVDDTLEGIELPPPLVKIVHNLRPALTGAPLKREVSKLHTALRDSHIQTAHARGWFQPERNDTSGELMHLISAGCLEYREILEPSGRYGFGRYIKQYRITPAGSRLLGLDHPVIEKDQSMDISETKMFKPGDKALFEGNMVTIRGHITENDIVSVELVGDQGHLVNRYVNVSELTPIPTTYQNLTQEMLDFVRQTHPDRKPYDMVAWVLMGTLKVIHRHTTPPDGWHEITATRGRLHDARLLAQGGLIDIRDDNNFSAWVRITLKGSAALGWPHPLLTKEEVLAALFQADPDDELASVNDEPQPEPVVTAAPSPAPKIEIKTLIQSLHYAKERSEADSELAGALMAGWHLVHIQIITHADALRRVVTLQRFTEPEPAPQPNAAAVATKSEPEPVIDDEPQPQPVSIPALEPIGEPVMILPARPVLELGPWGRAIRENGLDETLDIANQRVTDTFRQNYEESLARNQIIVRPLLPTQIS